jgi:hypothetical protein
MGSAVEQASSNGVTSEGWIEKEMVLGGTGKTHGNYQSYECFPADIKLS